MRRPRGGPVGVQQDRESPAGHEQVGADIATPAEAGVVEGAADLVEDRGVDSGQQRLRLRRGVSQPCHHGGDVGVLAVEKQRGDQHVEALVQRAQDVQRRQSPAVDNACSSPGRAVHVGLSRDGALSGS